MYTTLHERVMIPHIFSFSLHRLRMLRCVYNHKILTMSDKVVTIVMTFLPYLSVSQPIGAPKMMAVMYVTEAVQDMSELVYGSGAGPSEDWSTEIIGDNHPCTMPKLSSGIVTVDKRDLVLYLVIILVYLLPFTLSLVGLR